MTDTNPFESAKQTARRQSKSDGNVLADVEAVSEDGSMAAVSNKGESSKYAVRLPEEVSEPPVDSSVLVNTSGSGQAYIEMTMDVPEGESLGPETSDDVDYIKLKPSSQYVDNRYPYDGSDGFVLCNGHEKTSIPSGYYGDSIGTFNAFTPTGYAWLMVGSPTDGIVFDFSSVDTQSVEIDSDTIVDSQFRIVDDENGEILFEENSSFEGSQLFDIKSTSGKIRFETLDVTSMSHYYHAVASPADVSSGWDRPYTNQPNFATSGTGESWENRVNGGSKDKYSNVTGITSNHDTEYTFFSDTTNDVSVMDDGYVYSWNNDSGILYRFDRDDKSIDWQTDFSHSVDLFTVDDKIYIAVSNEVGEGELYTYDILDGTQLSGVSVNFNNLIPTTSDGVDEIIDMYSYNGDFIVLMDGKLDSDESFAFRIEPDGTDIWVTEVGGDEGWVQSCLAGDELFVVTEYNSNEDLFKLIDLTDGTITYDQWYSDTNIQVFDSPSPVYDGTNVFMHVEVSDTGALYKLDTTTQTDTFNTGVGYPSGSSNTVTLAVDDTQLYVCDDQSTVLESYATSDLSAQWTSDTMNSSFESMIVDDDTVYYDDGNSLQSIATTDGTVTELKSQSDNPVAVFDNELYVIQNNNIVKYRELA